MERIASMDRLQDENLGLRRRIMELEALEAEYRKAVQALRQSEERFKKAEDELRKSQEQLIQAQKMEALGTLVAGVAHEINNPINLIMYNLPLIQRVFMDLLPVLEEHAGNNGGRKFGGLTCGFLKENLGQLLSDMDMAANRVAKIVSDLKNFAKKSALTERKPVDLNLAVKNTVRLSQPLLRKSKTETELSLGSDLPMMNADLQSIEQIMLNITINAIQAIRHDHGRIRIVTGYRSLDGRLFFSVSDNGQGVDPAISDRVFDPFVTSKQAEGGTGLGLSVTYSLVKAHGGEIFFESSPGHGTTFTVFFPTSAQRKAAKILVADDNQGTRDLLTEVLTKNRPYLVEQAHNGIEACIRLGSYRPDLLILDVFMPQMDGLEVCRAIKKDPGLSDIRVIVTTGYPTHPKLREIADLGFTNIFHKPFSLMELLKAVDEMLAR
jgi:signal transduction histidine kinase/ActR/RegA family two-component response regulator